jgi:nucleotide-binding universal stress UspA family protein
MFDTMIVPLDGSPQAERALPIAVSEARRHGTGIVLLYVIPRPEPCTSAVRRSGPLPWQGEWPFEEISLARDDARAYLRSVATRFGLDARTIVRVAVGDPGTRIAAEAVRYERPLVVISSGRSREASTLWPAAASRLLIDGIVPLLAVPHPLPAINLAPTVLPGATANHSYQARSAPAMVAGLPCPQ